MATLPLNFAPGTLFSRIFRASPVAMTINRVPDGVYLDVNDSFAQLVGYSREELIGHRAIDLGVISPSSRQPVMNDLIQSKMLANMPVRLCHRSGESREVVVSAHLEEHDGEAFSVAIIQDLTEYNRALQALNTSEARFGVFFESIPLAISVFDLETLRILDANPAATHLWGYSHDELLSMTIADMWPIEERNNFLTSVRRQPDNDLVMDLWKQIKRNGTIIDVAETGVNLQLDGRHVRLVVLRDVTEQLIAERALVESEQRLQIITQLSTDGIWEWNLEDGTAQVNEVFRLIYGAPEKPDSIWHWWVARIHPEDRPEAERSVQEVIASGGTYWSAEFRILRAAGDRYANVIARGHLTRDRNGRPMRMTGALVDITHQVSVAEAVALAALAERQRLARDLHDSVTQSLYSTTLLAEVARRKAQAGDTAATLEHITRLGELSQQCLREMRLLIYELRPALVDEVGLVGALQQRLESVEQRSGVNIRLLADDDRLIPQPVQNELFRIAEEALNNALKHAQASSLTVTLKTTPVLVEMEIADNGKGFDAELAMNSGGQGLNNMHERATRLGGTFCIETSPGKTTKVRVRIGLTQQDKRPVMSGVPQL